MITNTGSIGLVDGDVCNRDGCKGIMREISRDGSCRCHINPPCSYCVDAEFECDKCSAIVERPTINRHGSKGPIKTKRYLTPMERYNLLDGKNIDWVSLPHTHFTMIKKGKFPEGTTVDDLYNAGIKGTFGGRFNRLTSTTFEYIAYTD